MAFSANASIEKNFNKMVLLHTIEVYATVLDSVTLRQNLIAVGTLISLNFCSKKLIRLLKTAQKL